jgi:hypothetical protein
MVCHRRSLFEYAAVLEMGGDLGRPETRLSSLVVIRAAGTLRPIVKTRNRPSPTGQPSHRRFVEIPEEVFVEPGRARFARD